MITREFDLMLYQEGNLLFINANQYDSGEQWIFTLYEENGVKYTPATGAIVGVKSDGHGIINTGTVDQYGRVVINETQQMTAAAGLATFELLIDNDTHGTANFKVDVEPRPADNADLSDSDLSLIQEAIDSAEVIVEVIGDSDPSEVIGEHVDAWLDAHPEATTTVQDGAITAPKINQSLWDKLLVSEEASGNPASFGDGADDVPVSSLKVALEPIQLGSGDPSPSNVRPIYPANGKNLADFRNGYSVNVSGQVVAYGTRIATVDPIAIKSGVSYKVVYSGNAANAIYAVFNGSTLVRRNVGIASGAVLDTSGGDKLYVCVYAGESETVTVDSSHAMVVDSSITDFTYQPYQGIMVERTGKNLLDASSFINKSWNSDSVNNTRARPTSAIIVPVGSVITVSVSSDFLAKYAYAVLQMSKDFPASSTVGDSGWRYVATTTVTMGAQFLGVNIRRIDSGDIDLTDLRSMKIQVEYGNTATAYVPFVEGASYPYSLGQSVYGGTVDLATGVLTVTWGSRTINGSESWARENVSATHYKYYINANDIGKPIGNNYKAEGTIICDKLITAVNSFDYTTDSIAVTAWTNHSSDSNYLYLIVNNANMGFDNVDGLKAWLASNPLQVAYKLATPQTIQLTPQEVTSLLCYNNISSSGTVEVIYHADTKLYVDKMTAVDNNIIATTEKTFTATRNYTVNDLVIVNDTLYKVTSNIATGSAITPNSNVTATTLSALIKALS